MRLIFAICILVGAVSKVQSHDGLAVPSIWMDDKEKRDSTPPFFGTGCRRKNEVGPLAPITNPPDGKTRRRLSTPNCYWLVFNLKS